MNPANPDALADAPYVLLKRGLFERPGHHGYTGVLRHAGRFSHKEASAYAGHGDGVTMMLASEAPVYSPACWHETQVEDLLDLLRIEREAKAAAEARAAQLQPKLDEALAEVALLRDRIDLMHIERGELVRKNSALRDAATASAEESARELASFNWWQNKAADNANKLTQERARAAQLQAEVEAKDRALKPFAEALAIIERDEVVAFHTCGDEFEICSTLPSGEAPALLTLGDLRAARAATAREGQADG
ncbi:hypothetical protein ACSD7O_19585 [Methylorubrum extorquens]|uniref:hypothetical protein n=1 Tax=Methylorubrum extorquens TaxID=408 RepID=UPI003F612634